MRHDRDHPPAADDKITMFRQQASMVERKKEQLQAKLDEQRDKKRALEKELEEKEGSFEAMGQMGGQMNPDEFRRMKQEFRAKSTQHKRLQKEMSELRAEKGVLQRTLQILESQCKDRE